MPNQRLAAHFYHPVVLSAEVLRHQALLRPPVPSALVALVRPRLPAALAPCSLVLLPPELLRVSQLAASSARQLAVAGEREPLPPGVSYRSGICRHQELEAPVKLALLFPEPDSPSHQWAPVPAAGFAGQSALAALASSGDPLLHRTSVLAPELGPALACPLAARRPPRLFSDSSLSDFLG